MAPRKPVEEEEVFTDLAGNPDPTPLSEDPLDLADNLDDALTADAKARRAAEEEDLKVVDEEEPGETEEEQEE